MKFAVIEYSSKSGQIWRHRPVRPNYLCDPITEIDPTSFGCYVSALAGEHIPLTALIKPNIYKKIIKRLSGSWPTSYDLSYLKKFEVVMIVHQISDGHEITRLVQRIRKELPELIILGVPTQPFGIMQDYWKDHPQYLKDLTNFMDGCHVFLTISASTLNQWRQLTNTAVEYLPQPYPVEFATRAWQPRLAKKQIILVAGITDRNNIKKGQLVAKAVQAQLPDYLIHVTKIDDTPLDVTNLNGARYQAAPFEPWQQHLKYLSQIALVINTDYTQTRGRVQVDCAAVGTPSIGADSDGQTDLFKQLPATPDSSISELVAQSTRLLNDDSFYNAVVADAKANLNKYSYEQAALRIKKLVDQIKV